MKSIKLIKLITTIFALAFCINAFSQNLNSFNYHMNLVPTGEVLNQFDTVYTYQCEIDLKKLKNIKTLYVKMGTKKGGDEKFSHSFTFGQTTELPAGTAYSQTDEVVRINIGEFFADEYWYEVVIEDSDGNKSTAKQKQY